MLGLGLGLSLSCGAVSGGGSFDWPNDSNTGPRIPVEEMTVYSGPSVILTPDTIVEGKIINTELEVGASGVIFRDCIIQSGGNYGLNADTAQNFTIEYCEISYCVRGLLARGNIRYNNIHGCIIAMILKDGASNIIGNFIHDLNADLAPVDPHFDGLFISGGPSDVLIEDNWIQTPTSGGTAGVFINTNFAGNMVGLTINHNRIIGTPSYQCYITNDREGTLVEDVVFSNNEMQRGAFGYWLVEGDVGLTRTGNVDAFTGVNIDAAL